MMVVDNNVITGIIEAYCGRMEEGAINLNNNLKTLETAASMLTTIDHMSIR